VRGARGGGLQVISYITQDQDQDQDQDQEDPTQTQRAKLEVSPVPRAKSPPQNPKLQEPPSTRHSEPRAKSQERQSESQVRAKAAEAAASPQDEPPHLHQRLFFVGIICHVLQDRALFPKLAASGYKRPHSRLLSPPSAPSPQPAPARPTQLQLQSQPPSPLPDLGPVLPVLVSAACRLPVLGPHPEPAPRAELAACSDRTKAQQRRERPGCVAY
jgi:hypothetical protein